MAEPVQLIILGGPGAGKGTQSDKINETYAIPHISTGDILREEVAKETKIGKQVEDVMERGELVADSIVLNLVEQRLRQPDTKSGFILDGFPRTIPQAKGLENILDKQGREDVKVILLEVSDEEMMNRLLDRGREDDTRKVIQNRIETYHQQTEQVIDYYQKRGNLIRINGEQSIEGVSKDIQSALSK
ncbi:MAG: adenylate kinase [Aliifodinibius sp.]|nr:adenylate kinase [Fodinibius sp.]